MKLDQRLNLIVPVEHGGGTIYVHSTPIGRAAFEQFYLPISKAFSRMYTEGLGVIGGPRVAMMLLRQSAKDVGQEREVEQGLVAEIRRLSNVVMSGPDGWGTVPLQEVLDKKLISEDDISEVENALAFFTLASWMYPRKVCNEMLSEAGSIWGAETSSLNCTEYAGSLKTSTETDSSGAKVTPSRVAY